MKYYNYGYPLGVIGVTPGHEDSGYTFLPNRTLEFSWIRTKDLHPTYEKAKVSPKAEFFN